MAENILNLKKKTDIQVQKTKRVPMNPHRLTPRHIVLKMAKERILKPAREKTKSLLQGNHYKAIS